MSGLSRMYGGSRPSGGGFETFSWYYFRISGVALFALVIIHLILMHITTDVACTTYAFVAARYANPWWRLFDWLLLTIALTHGMNGLRVVIDDYVRSPRTRIVLISASATLLLIFFMLGTITLITFQAVSPAGQACLH
jgi:succinate dehydrogenase / fumarate reductase membrane anchor subunit